MKADNWYQLIGILVQVAAGTIAFLQGAKWWLQRWYETKELKHKEAIELSKSNVSIQEAKSKEAIETAKANTLSAVQVAELLKQVYNVKNELEEMRRQDQEKSSHFVRAIEEIEKLLDQLQANFTSFLISKASNTNQ